ncbi:hypothetical protein CTEN210_09782 [Chaetoceros tenuissimus]|uniref:SAP domain-containing protein n=1 Tax=Chaetoceros tenuissimus TaxID=426638 RepID=A0AAD3CW52_9STRA|nr:hypothetical protein CTEN210_09782 [Chaetoceros tenuissimus]
MSPASKRMKLENGSSTGNPLEPSATINDLPSEIMKNIFSFVGKGSYYFIGPISKDFCFNYLTMDVIEDNVAHKMDYLQAIDRNKITTAEAVASSFDLAGYCFFKAPENFQIQIVEKAISEGNVEVVEMGHAMGIDVKKLLPCKFTVREIVEMRNFEMLKFLIEMDFIRKDCLPGLILAAANNNQLEVLKWLHENNLCTDGFRDIIFDGATLGGNIEIVKWTESTFKCRRPKWHSKNAVESDNIELVKYLNSRTWDVSAFSIAASNGNIELLQYLFENECPHDNPEIYTAIANKSNHEKVLEVIQWLYEHEVPWDEETCRTLIEMKNLKALKFAISNGCPWHEDSLEEAILSGNLEVVEYCLTNGCSVGSIDDCHYAMGNEDHDRALRTLKLLRKFSVPWSEETCLAAARAGNLQALKWAVSQCCPWDKEDVADYAAEHGHTDVIKWSRSQGCQWHRDFSARAASGGHLETLKYLISEGCQRGGFTFLEAMKSGNIALVEYCVGKKFSTKRTKNRLYEYAIKYFKDPIPVLQLLQKYEYPWHPSACKAAVHNGDLKLLRWLHFNGCAWDEDTWNEALENQDFDILRYIVNENGSTLKAVELKDQLRNLGLPSTGKKADLVTRLMEYVTTFDTSSRIS